MYFFAIALIHCMIFKALILPSNCNCPPSESDFHDVHVCTAVSVAMEMFSDSECHSLSIFNKISEKLE